MQSQSGFTKKQANIEIPEYPKEYRIEQIVKLYAGMQPDAVAVIDQARSWTYAQLEDIASRVARELHSSGVKSGDRVALLTARSFHTIAVTLAVLKCGAVVCPLDAAYPMEALRGMLQDCSPVFVFTDASVPEDTLKTLEFATVSIEKLIAIAGKKDGIAVPEIKLGSGEAGYILYTSGSTGRPKGVLVSHRGVVRLTSDQEYIKIDTQDTILHLAPLSFDASLFEIWGALLNGAKVAVASQHTRSIDQIAAAVLSSNASILWLTAGLFHLMVDHRLDSVRNLRVLLAGGDVLSPPHVDRAVQTLKNCDLVNGYGPTENTTFTCCYRVRKDSWAGGAVPIGKPLKYTRLLILDDDMRAVGDGEIGQLCIGGDGLSLGYLNQPELTAQSFVPDPYSDDPGEKLYLTGDLARRLPSGDYEFHGRKDRQIKIAGKRIELDAVEVSLREDPEVGDAIAAVKLSSTGDKSIVAYLKQKSSGAPAAFVQGLFERLRSRLPQHIVPSEIATVETFPLNVNGKVDRKRLAETPTYPISRWSSFEDAGIGKRDDLSKTEQAIIDIWKAILGVDVDLHDNFFDLGGKSLQLMRVHAEIQRHLGRDIPLISLFEHPKIADIAKYLDKGATRVETTSASRTRGEQQRALLQGGRKAAAFGGRNAR